MACLALVPIQRRLALDGSVRPAGLETNRLDNTDDLGHQAVLLVPGHVPVVEGEDSALVLHGGTIPFTLILYLDGKS